MPKIKSGIKCTVTRRSPATSAALRCVSISHQRSAIVPGDQFFEILARRAFPHEEIAPVSSSDYLEEAPPGGPLGAGGKGGEG